MDFYDREDRERPDTLASTSSLRLDGPPSPGGGSSALIRRGSDDLPLPVGMDEGPFVYTSAPSAIVLTGSSLADFLTDLRTAASTFLGLLETDVIDDVLSSGLPLIGDGLADEAGTLLTFLTDALAGIDDAFGTVIASLPADPGDPSEAAVDAALDALIMELDTVDGIDAARVGDLVTVGISGSEMESFSLAFAEGLGVGSTDFLSFDGTLSGDATFTYDIDLSLDIESGTVTFEEPPVPDPKDLVSLTLTGEAAVNADADLGFLPIEIMGDAIGSVEAGLALRQSGATGTSLVATAGAASLEAMFETQLISDLFPSIGATLLLDFPFPLGDLVADESLAQAPSISFTDVTLDPGSLIETLQATFGEVIGTIDVFPVGQIVDFLLTPFPIISDIGFVTDALDVGVVDGVVTVADLVVFAIENFGNTDLPSFDFLLVADRLLDFAAVLEGSGAPGSVLELGDITTDTAEVDGLFEGTIELPDFLDASILSPDGDGDLFAELGTLGSDFEAFDDDFNNLDATSFEIPLLDDPLGTVAELLFSSITGDPVTVVSVDFPPLGFAPPELRLPIPFGIFTLELFGGFGAGVDLGAGFAISLSEAPTFEDNFFLFTDGSADPSDPAPVVFTEATIGARGLADLVIVAAGIEGGVRATTDIFLNDPDMDGRSFLSELNPCTFSEIEGQISAFLAAVARIGFGPFSFTLRQEFLDVIIAQFGGDPCSGAGSDDVREVDMSGLAVVDGTDPSRLILNVGDRSDQRDLESDIDVDQNVESPQSPAVFENYQLSRGRDDDDNIVPGEVRITFNGVRDTFESTVPLDNVTGNFGSADDVLSVEAGFDIEITVSGGDGNDNLSGGDADDELNGNAGGDILRGGEGVDTLNGGADSDLLIGGEDGDLIDGGEGFDIIDYSSSNGAVTITPDVGNPGTFNGTGGDAEGDTISNVEHLIGSRFSDVLEANPLGSAADLGNILEGGAGNDTMRGSIRPDLLLGGRGADVHIGGLDDITDQEDRISYAQSRGGVSINLAANVGFFADAQGDTFDSIEFVQGSAYGDGLVGDSANNLLEGLSGNDRFDGRGGNDTVNGGSGDDTVVGQGDGDEVSGGGFANLSPGTDLIDYSGAANAVTLSLLAGQATVAGIGTDTLVGAQQIDVGAPPDSGVSDAPGFNTFEDIRGTFFADSLQGDNAGNRIEGLAGNDTMSGEGGLDTLVGGFGADAMDGGDDRDLADYSGTSLAVDIDLAAGTGTDLVAGANFAQGDTLVSIEDVTTGRGDDRIVGNEVANRLDPGLFSGSGLETVSGGGGSDTLILDYAAAPNAAAGFEIFNDQFGAGSVAQTGLGVRATLTSMERFRVTTGSGDDTIQTFTNGNDVIYTGGGNDFVDSAFGIDIVYLGAGDDEAVRVLNNDFNFIDAIPAQTFFYDGGSGFDTISLELPFAPGPLDLEILSAADAPAAIEELVSDFATVRNFEALGRLTTGAFDDEITVLTDSLFSLETGAGQDIIVLGDGDTSVDSGADDDVVDTGAGNDGVSAGTGDDVVTVGAPGTNDGIEFVFLGGGNDTVILGDERGRFHGEGTFFDENGEPVDEFVRIFEFGVFEFDFDQLVLAGEREEYALNPRFNFFQEFTGFDLVLTDQTQFPGIKVAEIYTTDRFTLDDPIVTFVPIDGEEEGGGGEEEGGEEEGGDFDTLPGFEFDTLPGFVTSTEESATASVPVLSAEEEPSPVAAIASAALSTGPDASVPEKAAFTATPAAPSDAAYTPSLSDESIEAFIENGPAADGPAPDLVATNAIGDPFAVSLADEDDILAELTGFGLSVLDVTLDGDSRAFGTFENFLDFETGIVVSTGDARDVVGPNTNDGPRFSAGVDGASVPLEFVIVQEVANLFTVYQAVLPDLGEIESIRIEDDNDLIGGASGAFTGFDLDFVAVSETDLGTVAFTNANELADPLLYPRLDVFDFGPSSIAFEPGTIRGTGASDLAGSAGTLVDVFSTTLDAPDYTGNAAEGGFLSLGDGGSVAFDFSTPVDTSGPTKYLTIVEVGGPEQIANRISVSNDPAVPDGDASTDLGAPGAAGDRSVLSVTFDSPSDTTELVPLAGLVFASEAFPELGGALDPDDVTVLVNGVSVGTLSDGTPIDFNLIAPSPVGIFNSDLVLNPVGTGPLADHLRLDGYTKPILISAPLIEGENTLEVIVEDGGDGLLDSAAFLFSPEGLSFVGGTPEDDEIDGTDDDDVIRGSNGDDTIHGGDGDDTIEGDSGNDSLDGGAGDDDIDGGIGLDTLCITADPDDVTLEFLEDGTIIVAGPDGTDTVRNVEVIVYKGAGPEGEDIEVDIDDAGPTVNLPPAAFDDTVTLALGEIDSLGVVNALANDLHPDEDEPAGDFLRVVQIEAGGIFNVVPFGDAAGVQGTFGILTIASDGTISYTLDDAATTRPATDSFLYTVEDGEGGRDTATITIDISDAVGNLPPVVTPGQSFDIVEGSAATTAVGTVLATDPNGDALAYAIVSGNDDVDGDGTDAFAIDATTGALTVLDPDDFDNDLQASFSLGIEADDGTLSSATETVTVNVIDEPPTGGGTLISFGALSGEDLDSVDADGILTAAELDALPASDESEDRNLYAITGDGDRLLEPSETGYKLADLAADGQLLAVPANATPDDPVTITAHGRINAAMIGDLRDRIRFTEENGFGVIGGGTPGTGLASAQLDNGESLTFDTKAAPLLSVSFTVQIRGEGGSTVVLLDADGSVITTEAGLAEGDVLPPDEQEAALLAIGVEDEARVTIDFEDREITIDGSSLTTLSNDAFFDALTDAGGDVITLGAGRSRVFGLLDTVLEVGEAPPRLFVDQDAISPVEESGDVGGTPVTFTLGFDRTPSASVEVEYAIYIGDEAVGILGSTVVPPEGTTVEVLVSNDAIDNGNDSIRLELLRLLDDGGGAAIIDETRDGGLAVVTEDDGGAETLAVPPMELLPSAPEEADFADILLVEELTAAAAEPRVSSSFGQHALDDLTV